MVAPSSNFYGKIWVGFCLNTGKRFLSNTGKRGFILKPTERAQVLLKSGTRDFQNSPPFERSASFYVTISENFKRFQYLNFETDILENENLFQKTGVTFTEEILNGKLRFLYSVQCQNKEMFRYKTAKPLGSISNFASNNPQDK